MWEVLYKGTYMANAWVARQYGMYPKLFAMPPRHRQGQHSKQHRGGTQASTYLYPIWMQKCCGSSIWNHVCNSHWGDHPYNTLRAELIKQTTVSEQRKLQQLIGGEELSNRKPTQLLRARRGGGGNCQWGGYFYDFVSQISWHGWQNRRSSHPTESCHHLHV